MRRTAIAVMMALLVVVSAAAADKDSKKGEQYASLHFTVLKQETGTPVRNASIVLHPVDKDGRQARSGTQLKTDSDGIASVDLIPYGKLRVQVIAPGRQTYGEDFDINQPAQQFTIKLNPPQGQYSIYK